MEQFNNIKNNIGKPLLEVIKSAFYSKIVKYALS